MTTRDAAAVRIGVSTCLLGENVRYDGGSKRGHFLTDTLGPFVQWAPVCPEVEIGMGIPREAIHLVEAGDLRAQTFVTPHPRELMLRNHV